ncbi:MAG TPA: hypothetical protein VGS11_13470 [Candidatus Bathyarchaeia archaeon]|nr:hypothetical protein [Candidatus Bathyarchaeia archaeon]
MRDVLVLKPLIREQICRIRALRRSGQSYKEVARRAGFSVSTVHKYAFKVRLDKRSKARIQEGVFRTQRNFVSKFARVKTVAVTSQELTRDKARLLGHILFDGIATRYVISYTTASSALARQFLNDLEISYRGLKPRIRKYASKNMDVYDVTGASIIACNDIRRFLCKPDVRTLQHLQSAVMNSDTGLLVQIVRAFWEDEGSTSREGNVTGAIKNIRLRNQILLIHQKLGIGVSPYKDGANQMFGIYVRRGHRNLQRFDHLVGFRKAIVTRGLNIGILKRSVLSEHLGREKNWKSCR